MMLVGDVAAQKIENKLDEDQPKILAENSKKSLIGDESKGPSNTSFRRYGTLSPNVTELKKHITERRESHNRKVPTRSPSITTAATEKELPPFLLLESSMEIFNLMLEGIRDEYELWDSFRTLSMCGWSVCLGVPLHMLLLRTMDIHLKGVASKVFFSFLFSIPLNSLFFAYGTCVHEITEQSLLDFRWDHALESLTIKLQHELLPTIQNSATLWIPFNTFNFACVPAHLRPLGAMCCSVIWNCYLSLAQHRD